MHALDTQYALERSAIDPGNFLSYSCKLGGDPLFHSYLNLVRNEMATTSSRQPIELPDRSDAAMRLGMSLPFGISTPISQLHNHS
jgi:hypothetical protein